MGSMRSKNNLAANDRREMHILSNEEKVQSIEDCVEMETAGAKNQAEGADAVVQQEEDDMTHSEPAGLLS
jgi:hypothetical protein